VRRKEVAMGGDGGRDAAAMIDGIGQIAIAVHDVERQTAFYRDALGLRFLFDVPGRMAFFDCGGVRLMLSLPEPAFDHPPSILYFRVAPIEAAARTLAGRGVAIVEPPHRVADLGTHELWICFFHDAEGHTQALMEEKPKVAASA
jgi:catechol 2,3-dioxygenase-like lactoylglutathione lyase family enzyme